MHPIDQAVLVETRRQFFGRSARGLGSIALASLLGDNVLNALAESVSQAASGRRSSWTSSLCAESEERDLPAYGGSAAAARSV